MSNISNEPSRQENSGHEKKRKKKSGFSCCLSAFTYILFVLGVSFVLSTFAILVANDMLGLVQDETPVSITLSEGETVAEVAEKLKENFDALLGAIIKAKPAATKGQYIKSCVIASTMGPGIKINQAKLS